MKAAGLRRRCRLRRAHQLLVQSPVPGLNLFHLGSARPGLPREVECPLDVWTDMQLDRGLEVLGCPFVVAEHQLQHAHVVVSACQQFGLLRGCLLTGFEALLD